MKSVQEFHAAPKILNGGIAGIIGVTCVFPLDLIKTRLQNQKEGHRIYKNIFECGLKTFKNEGFFGMYRGSAVNLLLITPEKAIKLVGNDYFRHLLSSEKQKLSLWREVMSGGLAGACQVVITTPMELLKIQLQDAGRSGVVHKRGATHIAQELVRKKGLFGLYRGFRATALRDVTFSCIYFPLFANLNALGVPEGQITSPFYHSFASGLFAGLFSSVIVTPLDVVKTRLQTIKGSAADSLVAYSGIFDCFRRILVEEGVTALFKGGACRGMVIAPLFGIAQTVYYLGIGEGICHYLTH